MGNGSVRSLKYSISIRNLRVFLGCEGGKMWLEKVPVSKSFS